MQDCGLAVISGHDVCLNHLEFATVISTKSSSPSSPPSKRHKKSTLGDTHVVSGGEGEGAGWSSLTNSSLTTTSTGYLDFVNGHLSQASSLSSGVMDASTSSSFVGGMMLCGDINTLDGINGMPLSMANMPFMGVPLDPVVAAMDVVPGPGKGSGQGLGKDDRIDPVKGINKNRPRSNTRSSTSNAATVSQVLTGVDHIHANTASTISSLPAVKVVNNQQPEMGSNAANGGTCHGCGCVEEWCMCHGNANGKSATSSMSALASNGQSTAVAGGGSGFHHVIPHAPVDMTSAHTNDNVANRNGVNGIYNPYAPWLMGQMNGYPLNPPSYGNGIDGGFGGSIGYHGHPMSFHPSMLLGGGEATNIMSTQPLHNNTSLLLSMVPRSPPLNTGLPSEGGGGGLPPSESSMNMESMQNVQALVQQVDYIISTVFNSLISSLILFLLFCFLPFLYVLPHHRLITFAVGY